MTVSRLAFLSLAAAGLATTTPAADIGRGAYLAQIMDCTGCHTGRTPEGAPDPAQYLTGSMLGFSLPGLGVFWPPNLTSDATGLGGWTDEQVVTAIRTGVRPDGRVLAPIMPYHSYAALTDEDAAALVAYLRTLPHAANRVPDPVGTEAEAKAPFLKVTVPQ